MIKKSVLIFITIYACKSDKKNELKSQEINKTKEAIIKEEKDQLSPNINTKVSVDDEFIVYYLDADDDEISTNRSISKKVVGPEIQQVLISDLPKDLLPIRLMIKTENNKENKVDIIDAKFALNDVDFDFSEDRFFDYFMPNNYIAFYNATSSYTYKTVDGKFNPSFLSRRVLIDK
jgi:hypothetical protein